MMWFDYVAVSFALVLSVPLLVIGFELVVSLLHKYPASSLGTDDIIRGTYKILMPAHNEANIIEKTLSALIRQGEPVNNIIVVADNCMDATAEIAENLGVSVLERFNDQQRGKGFALDYGISYLKEHEQADVLIILDADCEIDKRSIVKSVNRVIFTGKPIQMTYLMRVVNHTSLTQRVAGFAWLVKNKIRPIAVNKLGLPVTLTGTGMAFPWQVIADIKVAQGNIVEDMQLGIDCTLAGFPPKFCEQAVVFSDFPEQLEAEKTQRTRWEHGHLMTIFQQVPKLCKQAMIRKDWRLLGLALDIGVPPLALLVLLSVVGLFILAITGSIFDSYSAFFVLLVSFLFFTIMLVLTWWQFGRDYLTYRDLCGIPLYVISKLSIYFAFIFKRQKSWVRTARDRMD